MRFTQNAYCLFMVGVGIGLVLFVIAACSTIALVTHDDPLPQLLEVIEMPQEMSTTQIAVKQGGYAYVLNETTESIAVLDGPELVKIMRTDMLGLHPYNFYEEYDDTKRLMTNPNEYLKYDTEEPGDTVIRFYQDYIEEQTDLGYRNRLERCSRPVRR